MCSGTQSCSVKPALVLHPESPSRGLGPRRALTKAFVSKTFQTHGCASTGRFQTAVQMFPPFAGVPALPQSDPWSELAHRGGALPLQGSTILCLFWGFYTACVRVLESDTLYLTRFPWWHEK